MRLMFITVLEYTLKMAMAEKLHGDTKSLQGNTKASTGHEGKSRSRFLKMQKSKAKVL